MKSNTAAHELIRPRVNRLVPDPATARLRPHPSAMTRLDLIGGGPNFTLHRLARCDSVSATVCRGFLGTNPVLPGGAGSLILPGVGCAHLRSRGALTLKATVPGGAAAFDYLVGDWRVRHRLWLEASGAWMRFESSYRMDPILDGSANFDRVEIAELPPHPFIGSSIRIYDPTTDEWTIGWIDNLSHAFGAFVTGPMRDGRGEFHGERAGPSGRRLVRFRWRFLPPDRARWIQGVSDDDGVTWRGTWLMSFQRTPGP